MPTAASDGPAQELRARIHEAPAAPAAIARFLDALEPANRVVAIRGLGRADQRCLYQAVEGFAEVNLRGLVPAEVPSGRTVRHFGRNTLPAFTHFEKRFCRPEGQDARDPSELVGFNFQTLAPPRAARSGVEPGLPIPALLLGVSPGLGSRTARSATTSLALRAVGFIQATSSPDTPQLR